MRAVFISRKNLADAKYLQYELLQFYSWSRADARALGHIGQVLAVLGNCHPNDSGGDVASLRMASDLCTQVFCVNLTVRGQRVRHRDLICDNPVYGKGEWRSRDVDSYNLGDCGVVGFSELLSLFLSYSYYSQRHG